MDLQPRETACCCASRCGNASLQERVANCSKPCGSSSPARWRSQQETSPDISPDGDVRTNEWISVPLKFNDKDTVDVAIHLDEDARPPTLRHAWDIAKKTDVGFRAENRGRAGRGVIRHTGARRSSKCARGINATRLKTAGKHVKRAEEAQGGPTEKRRGRLPASCA